MPGCCAACKCPYPWCAKPQCECHRPGAERARRRKERQGAELVAWAKANGIEVDGHAAVHHE